MTTWTLILFVGVGLMGSDEANSLTTVNGFTSKATCESAGKAAVSTFGSVKKTAKSVCVEVK